MSTSVDTEAPQESQETAEAIKFSTIDLDKDGPVDLYSFGDAIRQLLPAAKIAFGGIAPETKTLLKFIVAQLQPENEDNKPQTRMYVFGKDPLHADLYKQILKNGGSYALLSAGYLDLTLGERNVILRGELNQYSDSLEKDFQLDKTRSDEYKIGFLVQKLGPLFTAR